jgi:hypothetical protein
MSVEADIMSASTRMVEICAEDTTHMALSQGYCLFV